MPDTRLENVIDLGYDQEHTDQPFTMAFAYPKSGPILIKGAFESVLEYMENNLVGVYHYRLSHWRKGNKRGRWFVHAQPDTPLIFKEVKRNRVKVYNLIFKQFGKDIVVETFETIPHEYIENFDLFQIGT
jgi:hypothetical protein